MSLLSTMTPGEMVIIGAGGLGVLASIMAIAVPDKHSRVQDRLDAMLPEKTAEEEETTPIVVERFGAAGKKIAGSFLIGPKEQEKMIFLLGSAGIAGKEKLAAFLSTKLTLAIVFAVLASVLVYTTGLFRDMLPVRLIVILGLALIGWRLPDMWVSRIAAGRKKKLREGIADALDLMVICTEAGLGLEQGMDRVARDLAIANPVVSGELRKTVAEMRMLPQMRDALDNFAKRSDLQIIRSIVTTLVQAIQYGTPLAHSLRVLSAEMRAHRMLELEARAARLPVLMTLPLILFILPCLFLIVAGPAMLNVSAAFKGHQ